MKNIFKKKKVVVILDTPNGSMIAWGESRFISHSKLFSNLKVFLKEKHGNKFRITSVAAL